MTFTNNGTKNGEDKEKKQKRNPGKKYWAVALAEVQERKQQTFVVHLYLYGTATEALIPVDCDHLGLFSSHSFVFKVIKIFYYRKETKLYAYKKKGGKGSILVDIFPLFHAENKT